METPQPRPLAPSPGKSTAPGATPASLATAALPPGYAPLAELRCDGMTRVVRARFEGEERLLRMESSGGTEARAELAVLAALDHPGIAPVRDHGPLGRGEGRGETQEDGLSEGLFVARTWIPGQDLLAWSEGKSSRAVGACVLGILPALAHLHERGFVHGDLKPENIVVTPEGTPMLVDFGLGRQVGVRSSEGGVSGTLFSIAPELLAGLEPTPASDLFALGVLLHRLFIGRRKSARDFYAEFPRRSFLDAIGSSPEELPDWCRDLVVTLTARETGRRPRSAAEFARVLSTRLGLNVEAEGKSPPLRWRASRGRERWMSERVSALSSDASALIWWRVPEGEDPFGLWEHLRLQLTLRGTPNRGLRLHQALERIRIKTDLESWAQECVAAGGLLVVSAGEEELGTWERHALETLARATGMRGESRAGSQQEQAPAPEQTRLLVVSPYAPAQRSVDWEEEAVPAPSQEDVVAFLRGRFDGEELQRLKRFGADLAELAAGSASALDKALGELQREGAILPAGGGFALRPGDLPDLRRISRDRIPAKHLSLPQARAVLGTLETLGVPLGFGELARQMQVSAQELAQSLAQLGRGGWIERRRAFGHLRIRANYRPTQPLLSRKEAAAAHAQRARELSRRRSAVDVVRLHELVAACLDGDKERLPQAVAAFTAELEALRQSGSAVLVLNHCERVERALGLAGIDMGLAVPEVVCELASAWCTLGRPNTAEETAKSLLKAKEGNHAALGELLKARIATARHGAERALKHYEKAAALDPAIAGEALAGRIQLAHTMGRDSHVLELVQELREEAAVSLEALPPRRRLAILSVAAMSAFRRGEVERAQSETTALLGDARRLGDADAQAALLINLATIERRSGSITQAQAQLEAAAELYSTHGLPQGLAHAQELLGGLQRELGEMLIAEEHLHASLRTRETIGDLEGATVVRASLGLVAYDRGQARAAIETIEAALESMGSAHRKRFGPFLAAKARAMLARVGRFQPAGPMRSEARSGSASDFEEADPRILLELGRAQWCADQTDAARTFFERARDLAQSLRQERLVAEAELLIEILDGAQTPFAPEAGRYEKLGALAAQDAHILGLILSSTAFEEQVLAEADDLAQRLERAGRDDRSARLLLALASRCEDREKSEAFRQRAERAFESASSGLTTGEVEAFRRNLLGFPDPYPGDLMPRDERGDNEEEMGMEVINLLEINRRLLQQQDLETLLGAIVESALSVTGAERGFFVLEEHGVLRFDTALDSSRGDVQRPELEVSRSVVSEALERMEPICVSNAVDDPLLGRTTSVVSLELRSVLCVPVAIASDLRGAIYVDHRLRRGAFDDRAARLCSLLASQAALAIQQIRRLEEIRDLNRELEQRVRDRDNDLATTRRALQAARGAEVVQTQLVGSSAAMQRVHGLIARAAPSDLTVLVTGESGTGKELVARALHENSARAAGPFLSENCAAIPEALIESEFFGYVRGAFTGAEEDRAGLFEQAEGGTLFLDEIGEMPAELQAKLLRVLETSEVRRLGSNETTPVNFRLIVATNRDLEHEVQQGTFRKDLFYRLDGIEIPLPTLSQHTEDIPELAAHFLAEEAKRTGTEPMHISKSVLKKLSRRSWPGNVRELRNEIARLAVFSENEINDPTLVRAPAAEGAIIGKEVPTLAELEQRAIMAALERTGDDKGKAAEMLGISRAKIYQRLKEWKQDG